MIAKQANKVLDYPIEPLPQDLLIKLPDITVGQRITAIRETRKLTKSQLRKKANIASSTYVYIEKRGTLPSPKHLFNISKALQVDPILIIKGKSWDKISPNLEDNEKMVLLRLRKGWNQTELATALESFGLKFETDILDAKRSTVAQWERGIAKPMFNKRNIIREVLGNDIFPQESKSTAEAVKRVGAIKKADVRIEKKVDEALKYLEKLDAVEFDKNVDIERNKVVKIIRLIIRHLKIIGGEEEAEILETELNNKITEIEKTKTEEEKISPVQRKIANQTLRSLLKEFPGKSIIQILPILVRNRNWLTVRVAIERIEKNQSKKLSPENAFFLNEVKSQLHQVEKDSSQQQKR